MSDTPINGATQKSLLEAINPTWENARVWGAVYNHRQACVRFIRDEVFRLLEDPAMTRRRLKRELSAIVKNVEEHGPPG